MAPVGYMPDIACKMMAVCALSWSDPSSSTNNPKALSEPTESHPSLLGFDPLFYQFQYTGFFFGEFVSFIALGKQKLTVSIDPVITGMIETNLGSDIQRFYQKF